MRYILYFSFVWKVYETLCKRGAWWWLKSSLTMESFATLTVVTLQRSGTRRHLPVSQVEPHQQQLTYLPAEGSMSLPCRILISLATPMIACASKLTYTLYPRYNTTSHDSQDEPLTNFTRSTPNVRILSLELLLSAWALIWNCSLRR